MAPIDASILTGTDLYRTVVRERIMHARSSVWIATANVKAMMVEHGGTFVPIVEVFAHLASRGVSLRLLHADKPSRPFVAALEKQARQLRSALVLRVCPRVHFKMVLVDDSWVYLGSANLTGAGLGAKDEHRRNFEMGFGSSDLELIDHATALFEAVWTGAECAQCKLHDVCPDPLGPSERRRRTRRRDAPGLTLGRARRLPIAR